MRITQLLVVLSIYFFGDMTSLAAQNMVMNPSFEEGCECREGAEHEEEASKPSTWRALAGSPRFLNPDCVKDPGQKAYIKAIKMPNAVEGTHYVGMGIDREGEYLEGQLTDTLEKGVRYWVKLRVRLPIPFCNTQLDELGVVLTDSLVDSTRAYRSIDLPSLKLTAEDGQAVGDQMRWQEISILYEAKGDEKRIIIGNFADNNRANFARREQGQCTYLYLDMVSVEKYKAVSIKNYSEKASLELGDQYILKNLEFETGLEQLKASSFKELEGLAARLVEKPELRLEISGHTDNTGDESSNLIFSKSRAQAVADFLIAKGAKKSQLEVVGKGSSANIAQNTNENNREKNRRIEIKVL